MRESDYRCLVVGLKVSDRGVTGKTNTSMIQNVTLIAYNVQEMSVKVEDVAQGYAHSDVFHAYASSQLEYPFSLPLSWVKPVFLIPYYFTSTIPRSGMQTYLDFVMSNGVAMFLLFFVVF